MTSGLIVGRFQPFHLGHLHLIKKALNHTDKLIIAVGSSNIKNENNPISYKKRVKMLETVIKEERLLDKIERIIPSPDHPDDKIWLDKLLKRTGKFDISIGNNAWVNGILKEAGYKVIKIPLLSRHKYQGTLIRKLFKQEKIWKDKVPEYLISYAEKHLDKSE